LYFTFFGFLSTLGGCDGVSQVNDYGDMHGIHNQSLQDNELFYSPELIISKIRTFSRLFSKFICKLILEICMANISASYL